MFKRFFLLAIIAFASSNAFDKLPIMWERDTMQEESFVQDVMRDVPPREDDNRIGGVVVTLLVEFRGGPAEIEEIDIPARSRVYNFFAALRRAADAFVRMRELEMD